METLLYGRLLLPTLTTIATATYVAVAYYFLKQVKSRDVSRRQKFFEALTKSFYLENIDSLDDVMNLFRGIMRGSPESEYKQGLTRYMREYLVYLVSTQSNKDFVNACKTKVSAFIKENETASPFSELPENERNILKDIREYLDARNMAAIKRKLDELSASIQTRYDDFKEIKAQNKWSVPLAVIGLVLTVIFGILSFFQ